MTEQQTKIITTIGKVVSALTAGLGYVNILPSKYEWVGLVGVLACSVLKDVLMFLNGLWDNTPSAEKSVGKTVSVLILLLIPAFLFTGCTSVYTNGCVTTVQNRFLGVQVTTTSSSTGTPSVLFGAGSSIVTVYPTSTNQLYCAPFFSTASGNTTANPFDVTINETLGAGNVASAIGTNGPSSSVVVPKLYNPYIK